MKKNPSIILGVLVLAALVAALWYAVKNRPQNPASFNLPPAIVGAIVGISSDRTQITVKAADGSSQTFAVSTKTPVITDVQAGQHAKALGDLSAGDEVAVAASPDNRLSANDIEVIPLAFSPSASQQPAQVITGSVVSAASSSIVIDPGNQPSGVPTTTHISIGLTKNTQIYTQVQTGQAGKTLTDIAPGVTIKVYIPETQPPLSASAILILSR